MIQKTARFARVLGSRLWVPPSREAWRRQPTTDNRQRAAKQRWSALLILLIPIAAHAQGVLMLHGGADPIISVPTITLEGDANGAPHPEPTTYAKKFAGKYTHRLRDLLSVGSVRP